MAERRRFSRNYEKGIDILARRVYVHHKPDADGSNPRSGKPAERRWFGRKSRLSAFSFWRTPRKAPPSHGGLYPSAQTPPLGEASEADFRDQPWPSRAQSLIRTHIPYSQSSWRQPGATVQPPSGLRASAKKVLTSRHRGCTFIAYRKRTGAIPKAKGQQNADGSGVKPGLVGVQLCRGPLEQGYLSQPLLETHGFCTPR